MRKIHSGPSADWRPKRLFGDQIAGGLLDLGNGKRALPYDAALSEIGHQGGSTDFELVAALKAYQQDQGLDVTGLPDQATLARLLR